MYVKDLAKQLGIGVSTLSKYGNTASLNISKANQRLTLEEVNMLTDIHLGKFKYEALSSKPANPLSSIIDVPIEFQTNNIYETQIMELVQETNLFEGRPSKTLKIGNERIETIFSDFEAASICSGLDDNHARSLARKYYKNECVDNDIIELHTISKSVLEKFGSQKLAFVLSLPPLPFSALDAVPIFSELDKRKGRQYFPILRISFININGETEKIQISFFTESSNGERLRNDNVIIVKNQTQGNLLMKISRDGNVIPEKNAKNIIPILQLFIRFSRDTNKMIINYGLETGECSICGRELTDKESIKRGIGPVCARN